MWQVVCLEVAGVHLLGTRYCGRSWPRNSFLPPVLITSYIFKPVGQICKRWVLGCCTGQDICSRLGSLHTVVSYDLAERRPIEDLIGG